MFESDVLWLDVVLKDESWRFPATLHVSGVWWEGPASVNHPLSAQTQSVSNQSNDCSC